ncbi:MAG TPA: TonB-dependent receptor [Rhizomicrobium sp.]|jgi:TonB-dependent receptor|nr:TonB-dependent receptor [Rhizomicrobium sp.]
MLKHLLCTAGVAALSFAASPAFSPALAQTLETVTVTASKLQAAEIKKDAPNVLDAYSVEQIRSLPDSNAAEALQRLPGIQMESDTGEGRFINIRGLDADLNGTTYDGVRLTASNPSSPQGGARAVAFDAFPAGILGGVEVMKSLNPDMDAEGLGGVVNILPRTIGAGQDHILEGSIGGGIESLRGSPVYKGDITAGKRFDLGGDQSLSVIFSYGVEQDHRGIDDIEEDYINDPTVVPPGTSTRLSAKPFDDLQNRWYQYHRLRQGYSGAITYTIDSDTTLYLRALHAGYSERAEKHEFVIKGLSDDILSANNNTGDIAVDSADPQQKMIATRENLGNNLAEIGGNTLLGKVAVDAKASWTQGFDRFPYSISTTFDDPNAVSLVYNNFNPNHPIYHTTDGTDLTSPANYTSFKGSNGPSQNTDTEYGGMTNVSVPLDIGGEDGLVKFGGSLRERTRKAQAFTADLTDPGLTLAALAAGPDLIYHNDQYNLGPQVNFQGLRKIGQTPIAADPTSFEDDNENVYAGYAQYSVTFDKFDFLGGVRVEWTDATYRANAIDQDGNIAPSIASRSYSNVFPDVSVRYRMDDDVQFRAAYTSAIARPGFNQITAAKSIDVINDIVSQGNPDLKPTTGNNFDLTASMFLPEGGIASIGLFYKAFSNYIIPTVQLNVKNYPDPRLAGVNVELDSFQNIGAAHAEGVELQYNQKFLFLPDGFSNFGFDGNLTLVNSSGDIRVGEKHSLPQTSPFAFNAGLFYDGGPLYVNIAASYVSRNLWQVGSDASTDLYSQPRLRLDFGSTYQINEMFQLYFDMKNLTNTHLEFTQTKSKDFPGQREYYEPDYLFGVRVKM